MLCQQPDNLNFCGFPIGCPNADPPLPPEDVFIDLQIIGDVVKFTLLANAPDLCPGCALASPGAAFGVSQPWSARQGRVWSIILCWLLPSVYFSDCACHLHSCCDSSRAVRVCIRQYFQFIFNEIDPTNEILPLVCELEAIAPSPPLELPPELSTDATIIAPDDSLLVYTNFLNAMVGPTEAFFPRAPTPYFDFISPGVRLFFRTNATRVELSYTLSTFTGLPCGQNQVRGTV